MLKRIQGMSLPHITNRNINCYRLLESNMAKSIKLKMNTSFDPVISLLIIYPIKMAVLVHKNTCTKVFTIALYEIAKLCKQLECSLIVKRSNKL